MATIYDVADYVQMHIPRPVFYVHDILPREGVMMMYGAPKVKKSWLVQHLGYCIGTGTEWLGFHTTQARVLLCQFEISESSFADRIRCMSVHYPIQNGCYYVVSPGLTYLDQDEVYNRFAAFIRPIAPQVIILDCLAACFGGDENNGADMARLIEKMAALKTEHHASLILIHHTNKNILTTSSVDKARGHSRLAGWVDTLAYMVEQPNGIQIQYKARQATRELQNHNIQFNEYNWTLRQ